MRRLLRALVLSTATVGLSGLAQAAPPKSYAKKCASCHGADGKAQTKMGKKLRVKDLTDPKFQSSFSDEQALEDLAEGLYDKRGKELMQPYKDQLTPDELKELLAFVRTLKAE